MKKYRLKNYTPRRSIIRHLVKIPVTITRNYLPRCRDCKHADEYIPYWIYPYGSPRCSVHHRNIVPGGVVCQDFELCGRLSR